MTEISASMVKDLREKTGAGMMDCKTALSEAGSIEGAIKILREKGLARAAKKTSRIATEGKIALAKGKNKVAMVELNCETDFVARNEDFAQLVEELAKTALNYDAKGEVDKALIEGQKLYATLMPRGNTVEQIITEKVATIGEKIDLRRFCLLENADLYGTYIHGQGSIGVVIACKLNDASFATNDEVAQAARDIAMHVAAANPTFISEADIPESWVNNERDIFKAQVLASGKPENMVDKIVDGKMAKHKKDFCLLDQPFVKNPDITVQGLIDSVKKNTHALITITQIARFKVGEGMEKKEDNFAEEVKKMTT